MTNTAGFDELGDAKKVKFREVEVAATLGRLDDMLAQLAVLRTEIDDTDDLVHITLGDDGQVITLFIDDAVARSLTYLGLERKLNDLFSVGTEQCACRGDSFGTVWLVRIRSGRLDMNSTADCEAYPPAFVAHPFYNVASRAAIS
jgi:hypothetical protein